MLGYKFRGLTSVNSRRDRRIAVPLPVEVNGKPVLLKNFGLGGLGFLSNDAKFEIGDDVLIELNIVDAGSIKIAASIIRTDGKLEHGVAFLGLSTDAFKLIESLEMRQFRPALRVV